MKRIFFVAALASFATGCVQQPSLSSSCGGTSGEKAVNIKYGDSTIDVNPKAFGKKNKELQFKLIVSNKNTDTIDYRDVLVTVTGKDAASSWISGSSTYNKADNGGVFFGGCLPDGAVDGTVYKYMVHVDKVGAIDPRVEVKK